MNKSEINTLKTLFQVKEYWKQDLIKPEGNFHFSATQMIL